MISVLSSLAVVSAIAALSFGAAWLLGPWSAALGERFGVVGRITDRSSHTRPVSRLGGVGLVMAFLMGAVLLAVAVRFLPGSSIIWGWDPGAMGWLFAGAMVMFCVGLADDLKDLPPVVKLLGQLLALVPLVVIHTRYMALNEALTSAALPGPAGLALVLVWVLFFTNAFNFMDGMDGFGAAFTIHVCLWLFAAALLGQAVRGDPVQFPMALAALPVLGAACAGFYRVNRSPARVFMGDSGSLTLGYWLGVQVLLFGGGYGSGAEEGSLARPGIPAASVLIVLLPFVFDVALTLARRARRGENLLAAHRSHLYQRLLICGLTHRETLALNLRYFLICGALGLVYGVVSATAADWFLRPALWFLWVAAGGAMVHYWRLVLTEEKRRGAATR